MKITIDKRWTITKEDINHCSNAICHYHRTGETHLMKGMFEVMEKLKHHLKKQIGKDEFDKWWSGETD